MPESTNPTSISYVLRFALPPVRPPARPPVRSLARSLARSFVPVFFIINVIPRHVSIPGNTYTVHLGAGANRCELRRRRHRTTTTRTVAVAVLLCSEESFFHSPARSPTRVHHACIAFIFRTPALRKGRRERQTKEGRIGRKADTTTGSRYKVCFCATPEEHVDRRHE